MKEILFQFFESIGFTQIDGTKFNITNSPIEEGEKVIGDLNVFEKTCLMFLEGKKAEHKELHGQIEGCENVEDLTKMEHKHDLLDDTTSAVRGMMWTSIKSRIPREVGATGIGLKDGNKIVASFKEKEDECDFLSSLGIMVIGMGRM